MQSTWGGGGGDRAAPGLRRENIRPCRGEWSWGHRRRSLCTRIVPLPFPSPPSFPLADWYLCDIPQHKYASPSAIPYPPLLSPQSCRTPLSVGVAWIHYTNYIDDTSMGHEIGGCFGCTDSAGTIFHAVLPLSSYPPYNLTSASVRFFFSVLRERRK